MNRASTKSKPLNPLAALGELGQSIWLDYIRRSLIASGELKRLIEEDGVRGVTSNPAIFEKAITGSTDYQEALRELQGRRELSSLQIYEELAVRDIQDAADALRPVYDETRRGDGYVSLEVSPFLAQDSKRTIDEALRLWKSVGRDNLMIKVPGTPEGIVAVERLIAEGLNVNVTLLFSLEVYERVARAYIAGLEKLAAKGKDLSKTASVASFFVSRIDTAVDGLLAERLKNASKPGERALLEKLRGKAAIANAKLAYQRYKTIFQGDPWLALAAKGARTQRLLWASTGTKNPDYGDVMYVEELIGPDTVNTVPPATLDAFRAHGKPRASLEEGLDAARGVLESLERLGISLKGVTDTVLQDGLRLFAEPFDKLLNAVDAKCRLAKPPKISQQTFQLPEALARQVRAALDEWRMNGKVRRLWSRDASLWSGRGEERWMGWLGIIETQKEDIARLISLQEEVRQEGFTHALLLGMGGSSLAPEVLKMTFGQAQGCPELHVLDSTDPAQIKAAERKVELARTLFIVSSKSGSTLEPDIYKRYFFERVKDAVGAEKAGRHFIAITDPGSKLEQAAKSAGFRRVFHGVPGIGGRYSALSDFGMVPAAVMGLDVARFLDQAEEMAVACSSCVAAERNPGVMLGLFLGAAAWAGRDKVTIIASPTIQGLGAWLEQLLAESTGKEGKGLIPVDREPAGRPEVYGEDRIFAYLRLQSAPDPVQDTAIESLERAGQPVVRINVADPYDLGQEFFRWEIATAVAGSILGINPFDQPDVEASKEATRKLTEQYEKTLSLPAESPFLEEKGVRLFADEKNAQSLIQAAGRERTLAGFLRAHLNSLKAGDYFALLAYVAMTPAHETELTAMRAAIRERKRVATCVGFGPRFLHSTGQAYKGGPNTGVFLQITCADAADLPAPGKKYTFGVVKAAQARGDLQVLAERKRRALRVHLGADVAAGLAVLRAAVQEALAGG